MAKTVGDGVWPREFEYDEDDDKSQNQESYHTLARKPSPRLIDEDPALLGTAELNHLAQPSVDAISRASFLKKGDLPE